MVLDIAKKQEVFHTDGFPLSIMRFNPQPPLPPTPHTHEFTELVIITGGQGRHISGRSSYLVSTGDVFVICGSRSHSYIDMQDLCLINILFDPLAINLKWWDLVSLPGYHTLFTLEPNWRKSDQFRSRLHLPGRDLSAVLAMVDQLDNELTLRKPGFKALATSLFMQMVVVLSRCYQNATRPDAQALLRLGGAIAHLEQCTNARINLNELAGIAHMSKRNFLRAFKRATGTSPIKYHLQIRVARAATELRQSGLSITQIAFDHGFSDSNYFSRQFSQFMGVSPREYRRRFL